jgi:hypothetical protein
MGYRNFASLESAAQSRNLAERPVMERMALYDPSIKSRILGHGLDPMMTCSMR